MSAEALSSVASHSIADTIYEIDKFGEEAIREWFEAQWPGAEPVEVVMEGVEEPLCFPRGTPRLDTKWKCLLDPIDGTRGIMYDKRSAWALSGIAPQRGDATRLSDIVVASMTELPTRKQWRADQVSAMRGGGLVASAVNVHGWQRLAPLARSLERTRFSAWIRMDGQVFSGRPRPHGANRGTTLG